MISGNGLIFFKKLNLLASINLDILLFAVLQSKQALLNVIVTSCKCDWNTTTMRNWIVAHH